MNKHKAAGPEFQSIHMATEVHSTNKDAIKSLEDFAREAKEMREHQSEKEIDKTIQDSFPASDPPGNY